MSLGTKGFGDFSSGQWLRRPLPMRGVGIRSLIRELKTCMPGDQAPRHKTEAHCSRLNKVFENGSHKKKKKEEF